MSNWEDQSLKEYLFEVFCQDKIERELQYLMMPNTENNRKQSEPGIPLKSLVKKVAKVTTCETCLLFEGWKDSLGLPFVKCKFSGETLEGCSTMDLYGHIHPGQQSTIITVTSESP